MKLDATAQRLPPGIQPVFMPRLTQGVCRCDMLPACANRDWQE